MHESALVGDGREGVGGCVRGEQGPPAGLGAHRPVCLQPRITHQTYAHVMPDAPERLRSLMGTVFTMHAELNLPLEFEAVVEEA